MEQEFTKLVAESFSITDLSRRMGYFPNTYRINKLRQQLEKSGLDYSHFSKNGLPPRKKLEKVCPICKTQFVIEDGHRDDQVTCSRACSNTYFARKRNKNPKQYTTICWYNHGKKCVVCGEERIVEVHHMDENNKNNDPKNLVPLCPTHHQYWHSRYRDLVRPQVEAFLLKSIKS
jgi:hypothetical protein